MSHSYAYARSALAADVVLFGAAEDELEVLLIERGGAPFLGCHALPGGFVRVDEDLEAAVRRELAEEAGVSPGWLQQLQTFGRVDRDPRERVVTVAYWGLVRRVDHRPVAGTDARAARWHRLDSLPALAFDHREIVDVALRRLQVRIRYEPVGFELLPEEFPLSRLQGLYETILRRPLDKRNFRRKVLALDILAEVGRKEEGVSWRPAQLYRFDRERYQQALEKGVLFDL